MNQKTKIVATLGPASQNIKVMEKLIRSGVDAFRLNFSHGTYENYEKIISDIKKARKKLGVNLPIILDTKGPEIRTADIAQKVELKKGDEIIFTISNDTDSKKNRVSYDGLVQDIEIGEKIMIDSGLMSAEVLSKTQEDVVCKMLNDGILGSRRHINLPGKDVSLPSITDKDWSDIEFGIKHNLDFCAMSFVRRASDVNELREFLHKNNSKMKIIAKIENKIAVDNLSEVIKASDGVMVARGDLGVELPYYKVPKIQREIMRVAAEHQKFVIVATEMLDSMIKTPYPTRAEVADISTAVFQKTDATMLSGETAAGDYPIKSVEVMREILRESQKNTPIIDNYRNFTVKDDYQAMAKNVAEFDFYKSDIKTVIVITKTGRTAESVSTYRPQMAVHAFTDDEQVARQMNILWGVEPYQIEFDYEVTDKTVERAQKKLLATHPKLKGQRVILLSNVLVKNEFVTSMQIREL